jgi:hypothetical protein
MERQIATLRSEIEAETEELNKVLAQEKEREEAAFQEQEKIGRYRKADVS